DDDRGKGHGEPNANRFDRQPRPRPDVESDKDAWLVFPPAVRQSERRFPKQADKQKEEKRKTECAPVDEWLRRVKETTRWNQRSANEINEIPRKTVGTSRPEITIANRHRNQRNTKQSRNKMKTDDARYAFSRHRVIGHVVCRHPIFIAPDITQQH